MTHDTFMSLKVGDKIKRNDHKRKKQEIVKIVTLNGKRAVYTKRDVVYSTPSYDDFRHWLNWERV